MENLPQDINEMIVKLSYETPIYKMSKMSLNELLQQEKLMKKLISTKRDELKRLDNVNEYEPLEFYITKITIEDFYYKINKSKTNKCYIYHNNNKYSLYCDGLNNLWFKSCLDQYYIIREEIIQPNDNYYMDIENEAFDQWPKLIIKGKKRILNKEWMNHMKKYLDNNDIDNSIEKYKDWVLNGGGDEWFQP